MFKASRRAGRLFFLQACAVGQHSGFVILSEAMGVSILSPAEKLHRSFASPRMTGNLLR
jgi:hypothetical protein